MQLLRLYYAYAADKAAARVVAHRLLECAWLEQTGTPLPALQRMETGKPYVPGGRLAFSVTHSQRFAACALADGPVGLDAEWIRPVHPRLLQRLLDDQERSWVEQHPELPGFLQLWTLREAYVKYTGEGLAGFGNYIHFTMDGSHPDLPGSGCYFQTYRLPAVVLALCTATPEVLAVMDWTANIV